MSAAAFTVEPYGHGWAVHQNGERVAEPVRNKWWADEQRDQMERDARQKERNCMTCRQPFMSEGPHNRMCNTCRQRSQEIY